MTDIEKNSIEDIEILISPVRTSFIVAKKKPSFREMEEVYGIPKSTIKDICDREDWESKRAKYHRSIITDNENKIMSKVRKERMAKLGKINEVFNKGVAKLLELIDDGKYVVSVRDLNTLIRVGEFLEGNPEEIKEKRFKLDKPLSEYTLEELVAMKNKMIEGEFEVINDDVEQDIDQEYIENGDENG